VKIAFITRSGFGVLGGGASYYFPALLSVEHEVLVITPASATKEEVVRSSEGIRVSSISAGAGRWALYEIYRQLEDFKPDIVHVFHSPRCLAYVYGLKSFFPKAKWVLDFRSPPVVEGFWSRNKLRLKYYISQFCYDVVVTHSFRTIRDNVLFPVSGVLEVPPGVELSRVRCKDRVSRGRFPERFVYVGSVSRSRQVDKLINAFAQWAQKQERAVRLDVIGGGNALEEMRRLVREKELTRFVSILGALPQECLFNKIAEYDAGIAYVPYDHFARAPSLKSLEYAAAGLPILASDTEGHKDYSSRFGFKFSYFSNNQSSMIRALESFSHHFATDDSWLSNLERVRPFDWKVVVERLLLPIYSVDGGGNAP